MFDCSKFHHMLDFNLKYVSVKLVANGHADSILSLDLVYKEVYFVPPCNKSREHCCHQLIALNCDSNQLDTFVPSPFEHPVVLLASHMKKRELV